MATESPQQASVTLAQPLGCTRRFTSKQLVQLTLKWPESD
jgi:hypothetical protein